MSVPEAPSINYHPYSHALQIRVYQAFIFSIPILFSIILFLLFYLFYLKRRAYAISSSPPTLPPSTFNYATSFLPMEISRISCRRCCVCLGEFEMNEELIQVPSCKHIFHRDCIHHWLQSNSTCPLCRCCVFLAVGPLSLPVVGPPTEPHSSGDDDDPPTEGTTCEAQGTTTTTAAASSSNSNCLRVSSNSSHVSSGLSVVIHVGVGPQ
ncbi:hypothetical protein Ccrd_008305 [Cynara cardunculus var. scolymus]|uniref:RING-type E3 ubiquitin transferase n=1 Tax=Cynara cardunculus var. scolymus TaxID=59895 RepID=A0A103XFC7_CYNCS|nr:hypothetical protein Ccrd_008305 [Cynara cardunculus var. scolymus]